MVHNQVDAAFADPELTTREAEVLRLLSKGFSNRSIAEVLFLSEATVKVHVRRVFQKIHVRTRTQAVIKAAEYRF